MLGTFYIQSSYSMLKNMIEMKSLIKAAKAYNYDFIALSDESLHGLINFYEQIKDSNIKPVIGINLRVLEPFETEFLIYVKNQTGYLNLLEIVKLKNSNHKFSVEDLIMRENGLIFVSSGFSIIDRFTQTEQFREAKSFILDYKKYFNDFYIGINYQSTNQYKSNLSKLANELNIHTVLVNKTSYLKPDDKKAYEALIALEGTDEANGSVMLSKEAITAEYIKYPNLKTGTKTLIASIDYNINFPKYEMPAFETPNDVSEETYLESLARVGLKKRLSNSHIYDDKIYRKRLEHELKIITEMNFSRYFLIVYDFVKYAKQNDILVGPGRGSAAGSLVSYCLGITNIDPIHYNLMFERFLNPERVSMPDIDLDFPDNKRDLVIDYVKEKYGQNHITSITTFNTFAVNSSIRDIARIINFPQERISGVINVYRNKTYDESDLKLMELINIAEKIKGLKRHTGTHPAGIILSDKDLTKSIPMQLGAFNFNQSVFEASDLEGLGLIKIDFLGLKNLTIIHDILKIINTPKEVINLDKLPLNNKAAYNLLSKGNTTGIFQLESSGMRNVLRKLKPNNFEDIIAILALYRPGPMENIDEFIARRAGKPFKYLHNDLKPILKDTFGIIIYQEQIMQIAQTYAGYNLFEADMLRVGVSKKDLTILENERTKFVQKSVENNYLKEDANEIYDLILRFANYGFNRSHSVAYSLIAYQMAYLKANYYNVFMSVLLTHVIGNVSQTNSYISEAISNGLNIYPPNLNLSTNVYIPYQKGILMPLTQIKGIGDKTYEKLIELRRTERFKDFNDIKTKLSTVLSNNEFINLIRAGALDFTKINRRTLELNSDFNDIVYAAYVDDVKINEVEDYTYLENMENELSSIGTNLTFSISTLYDNPRLKNKVYPINVAIKRRMPVKILGIIKESRTIKTKKDEDMAFITISDGIDELELTVFPSIYEKYSKIDKKSLIIFEIQTNVYKEELKYLIKDISVFDDF